MIKCAYDELIDIDLLQPHPKNPNIHTEQQIALLAKIMAHQGWRNPITVSNQSGFIVAGHGRLMAAQVNKVAGTEGFDKAPVDKQDFTNEADEYAHMIADNKIVELANVELAMVNRDFVEFGPDLDVDLLGIPDFIIEPIEKFEPQKNKKMVDTFLAPPFSVLDARQGYWGERKKMWLAKGIKSEVGRSVDSLKNGFTRGKYGTDTKGWDAGGASVFDPVLCEIIYTWFSPKDGLVLDSFAGGSVRGVVASLLGRQYIGVELRKEQVAANRGQENICNDPILVPLVSTGRIAGL